MTRYLLYFFIVYLHVLQLVAAQPLQFPDNEESEKSPPFLIPNIESSLFTLLLWQSGQ